MFQKSYQSCKMAAAYVGIIFDNLPWVKICSEESLFFIPKELPLTSGWNRACLFLNSLKYNKLPILICRSMKKVVLLLCAQPVDFPSQPSSWNQGEVYSCHSESLYAIPSIERGEGSCFWSCEVRLHMNGASWCDWSLTGECKGMGLPSFTSICWGGV